MTTENGSTSSADETANEKPRFRLRKRWIAGILFLIFVAVWLIPPPDLVISPETTHITAPLTPDGRPDYVAAFNAICSEGVTAENNAAPMLMLVWDWYMPATEADIFYHELERILSDPRIGLKLEDFENSPKFISWDDWIDLQADQAEGGPSEYESWADMEEDRVVELLQKGQLHPQLPAYLEANAPALELVRQAALKERFYIPLSTEPSNPAPFIAFRSCDYLISTRQTLNMRALWNFQRGNHRQAWEDLVTMRQLARLMEQRSLATDLVMSAFVCEAAGERAIALLEAEPDVDILHSVLDRWQVLAASEAALQSIDISERFRFCHMILSTRKVKGHDIPLTNIDLNCVLREANSTYDETVAALRLKSYQDRQNTLEALDNYMFDTSCRYLDGPVQLRLLSYGGAWTRGIQNAALSSFLLNMMPAANMLNNAVTQAQVRDELTVVGLALAIHKAEKGEYPEKLEQLVPDVLAKVPQDEFSGKPFVYRRTAEGYLLYSVGPNLVDDGGRNDDDKEEDDLAIMIPSPPDEDEDIEGMEEAEETEEATSPVDAEGFSEGE